MTKPEPRVVAYIPPTAYVKGHGFRVSFVIEGETGHHPTGTWPYDGAPGTQMPWFWGHDHAEAVAHARDYNERLGVDAETAEKIVLDSMRDSLRGPPPPREAQ